jgi:enamine deaminase RidA (YjgF/YER057c/UK114 family)
MCVKTRDTEIEHQRQSYYVFHICASYCFVERAFALLPPVQAEAPTPFGTYVETVQTGQLLFMSGMLPVIDRKPKFVGRLGKELDVEQGRDAAYTAALSALAAARHHLGSLDRVTRVVRLGIFIATFGDFFDQPKVADGASDLFKEVFGPEKTPVRLVIGVASLPLGMPVEVEVILEVEAEQGRTPKEPSQSKSAESDGGPQ